jgi:ATP-dependent Clp protease ATP-binding subunit ClpA
MSNGPDLSRLDDPDFSRINEVGTPRLRRILASSAEEAVRRGRDDYIGVEHVFLAMLADGRSVPIQLLARHLDLDAFREELSSFLASDSENRR